MNQITLRNVPEELHLWLKQQAASHRRSVNQEIITLLNAARSRPAAADSTPAEKRARIRRIAQRTAELQVIDTRSEEDILGSGPDGLPT